MSVSWTKYNTSFHYTVLGSGGYRKRESFMRYRKRKSFITKMMMARGKESGEGVMVRMANGANN